MDAACDNVARRKLGVRVRADHETLAIAIDQKRAVAPNGLRSQRRGIAPNVECGRVKLHELRIGDHSASPRRHAEAPAIGFLRVGGDTIKLADPACGEHHGARRKQSCAIALARARDVRAHDAAVALKEFDSLDVL